MSILHYRFKVLEDQKAFGIERIGSPKWQTLYNILKIAELECCQIIILSIYVPSTRAYTHVLRLSLDLPYETW
jgi:hypothetical protein